MDDKIEKNTPKIQADNQSIAIGEINITGTVTGNITIGHTIVQPADARLRHELGILLKNVQTTWIQGVLEKSVHEAALLELGLELREEAVDNPWRMVIEGPDQSRETLPRGRRIKDIFDEANRLLLILGEPGSGKTTTLLQLARELIAEVDDAFTQPVPVILNLSTWTNKAQPLDEWLVAELNGKYRLPKKDGQRWLRERRILPLLDGLDEVRVENRAACVEKINQLVTDYGLQGMVVCSRIKDYTALNVRLAFYRAIYIQPLTPEQVNEYLERASSKLASLRTTLQADLALRSMAQSPLILNIMSLAYQNASAEALSDPALNTNKARRQHLFDTYIARMFNRKVGTRQYEDKQTKQRLSWLARNMQEHNQEVFLVEGLQPTWLSARSWQRLYFFASRLVTGVSFMLILRFLRGGWAVVSVGYSMKMVLIAAISLAVIDVLRFEWFQERNRKVHIFWRLIINFVVTYVMYQLTVGVSLGFYYHGLYWDSRVFDYILEFGPSVMLVPALIFGLIFGARGSRQSVERDIDTIEALRWSPRGALIGGVIGGILGFIFFLVSGGLLIGSDLTYWVNDMIRSGLGFGLLGAIYNGIRSEIIATKSIPNQGIRLSIRNAIFGGLIVGISVGLSVGLYYALSAILDSRLNYSLSEGLLFGTSFGLIGTLWYGGLDVIQHYSLRVILVVQGHAPANYARFLNYAVDRIFLQKVGGGYRFIHRLLLEHFAQMGEMKKV